MLTVGIIPSPGIAHQHVKKIIPNVKQLLSCLLYTSDAADDMQCVELRGSRLTKKKKTLLPICRCRTREYTHLHVRPTPTHVITDAH
ncbi:hypothetical protein CDFC105_63939 [Clostridioides difficile]|nr:hypothetical protein CDFC105_63939 [Clostridioides difficile]